VPAVEEEQIQAELDGLRERLARLEAVERPAQQGDFIVVDYVGSLLGEHGEAEPFEGGEGRDQLVELGSGNLIEGFEEALLGASAGEQRTLELSFPADYAREQLAGLPARFEVTVKEVKRKELPDVDDDLAIDTGFDSLAELRGDIEQRLREAQELSIENDFREAALDAAVENARLSVPAALVEGRAREMWERMLHSLSHRGISRETYLSISDRSEEEILTDMAPEAERALRREAVLTAVVAAEAIAPHEEQLLQALAPAAEREQIAAPELLERLRAAGRLDELREDLAARQAMDLIAQAATPIAPEQARAREQLWTPEKERAEHTREENGPDAGADVLVKDGGLWTPDR